MPAARFDARFSDPAARATPWEVAARVLEEAELYWLTTVRAAGRPHVTPLVGVFADGAVHFCTGRDEQKARNLAHNRALAVTTGVNTWAEGLDVVVEGTALRIEDDAALQPLADAWAAKYPGSWEFEVGDGLFHHGDGGTAAVFRVEPAKAFAFAKRPHGQTSYRFG